MVRTRPGKPGKSWNLKILNSRPGKSWKTPKKSVSPGKVLEFHLTSHLNLFWLKRQQDLRPELQVSNGIWKMELQVSRKPQRGVPYWQRNTIEIASVGGKCAIDAKARPLMNTV